jgi:hypothetical protein
MTATAATHVNHEDEAAATTTASKTETGATHHVVHAAAHQLPPALADPTSYPAAAPSRLLPRPAISSRRSRPTSR